ncbi:MAG: DUF5655 domain-containing protein [Acidimicrobiia bacterium]
MTASPAAGWTCPDCGRRFGRANQSHSCRPTATVDAVFAGRTTELRAAYDAMATCIGAAGPVVVDATDRSVYFKRRQTFAAVQPKRACLAVEFVLSSELASPRLVKRQPLSAHRVAYTVEVSSAADVDDELQGWLRQAYEQSPT